MGSKVLVWQTGYGVVSFGTGDLKWVVDYVRNQKQRHSRGRTVDRLERMSQSDGVGGDTAEAEQREAP
jgi:hypothetical protein